VNAPQLPHDLDAEENLVSAIMFSTPALEAAEQIIRPGDFWRNSHGLIYQAAQQLHTAGDGVDPITVCDHLERTGKLSQIDGGRDRIRDLAQVTPIAGLAANHARIVHEMAELRALINFGQDTARLGWERPGTAQELLEQTQQRAYDLAGTNTGERTTTLSGPLKTAFDRMTELSETGREIVGIPSGFRSLDRITSGLEAGSLIVAAARPGMGKSSLALAIAANVSVHERLPVAIFSIEMSKQILAQRFLAREANVSLAKIRAPGRGLATDEWARLAAAANTLTAAPIHVNDRDNTLTEIRSEIRRLKTKEPNLALVVVDYMQLMNEKAENRTQEITKISRGLKKLAGDYDVPVLALSQLNRNVETRIEKRPQLADLRESGSIEQDADIVIFIYREGHYNDQALDPNASDLTIAKNRNGAQGRVELRWDPARATFRETAHA
jgi:replicative DNA helicase